MTTSINAAAPAATRAVNQAVTQAVTQPVPTAYHDPSWLVQRAWSMLRLPRLQEVIRTTIAGLESLPQPASAHCDWESSAMPARDPVAEALQACCEELRDAAGMPGAEADRTRHCRAVRVYIEQQPLAWGEAFSTALDVYRRAATQALEKAFARPNA